MRKMLGSLLIALSAVIGCGEQPSPKQAVAKIEPGPVQTSIAPVPAGSQPGKPVAPPPPPQFKFPDDAAGKAVAKVVAPRAPEPLPLQRFDAAPGPRTAAAGTVDPDPRIRTSYLPPPLLPGRPAGLAPASPAERIPSDLGFGASTVPSRPILPDRPGITQRAADVGVPPKLAPLGRRVPDRASLDDPTTAPANAAIVRNSPAPVLEPAAFLKAGIPDPYELGNQVKPRVAPTAEPDAAPIPVTPQRPK